jgi:excisionase family DNA binding protein
MPVPKPVKVDKVLYTPIEAAQALGMSRSTIYVLMANGDVPSVRIGASRRIPAEGLRRYVARLAAGSADEGRPPAGTRKPEQQPLWR